MRPADTAASAAPVPGDVSPKIEALDSDSSSSPHRMEAPAINRLSLHLRRLELDSFESRLRGIGVKSVDDLAELRDEDFLHHCGMNKEQCTKIRVNLEHVHPTTGASSSSVGTVES